MENTNPYPKAKINLLTKSFKKVNLDDNHVKNHYDKAASRKAPRRTRFHDETFELKKYHNDIKLSLISTFLPHPASHAQRNILDLCCGQGTDIHKWHKNRVSNVVAVDLSPLAVAEANKRYTESGYQNSGLNVSFHVADIGSDDLSLITKDQRFPLVTCFFAIQYFFKNERMLSTFLKHVSDSLLPGGFFVGTCPDAKKVISLITEDAIAFASPRVLVERLWSEPVSAFGSQVALEIKNTVTWGDNKNRNVEYLVYESVLKKAAEQYGLYPVEWPSVHLLEKNGSQHGLFRGFSPNVKVFGEDKLDLHSLSRTYSAFVFVKKLKV